MTYGGVNGGLGGGGCLLALELVLFGLRLDDDDDDDDGCGRGGEAGGGGGGDNGGVTKCGLLSR